MAFKLPDLPYDAAALEPYISAETLEFHHGKHHRAYVDNVNKLIQDADLGYETQADLEGIILSSDGALFNNAAQVWNHSFYWQCMKPGGGGVPIRELADAVELAFGSYEGFRTQFTEAAMGQFGSGWAWLVVENGALKITKTGNADLPLKHGQTALLTIDVWEHAYYIDYRNQRAQYIEAFLGGLVDWDFVAANFANLR